MSDGYRLPMRIFAPPGTELMDADQVVLALHGFNNYGKAIKPLGTALAKAGILTYAIDQRGHGSTFQAGRWHGGDRLRSDLRSLLTLLRSRHPKAQLTALGISMGAAVVMSAEAEAPLPADGLVLIAPAVWSRESMPWLQRTGLDLLYRIAPGMVLTGEGLNLRPTDNEAVLRDMWYDPLVIKETRVEALWGVTNLMDSALAAGPRLSGRILVLYGAKDEIIPVGAFCRLIKRLPDGAGAPRLVLYRRGWHMLTRDLQRQRVHRDIAVWIGDPSADLPSREQVTPTDPRIVELCRN